MYERLYCGNQNRKGKKDNKRRPRPEHVHPVACLDTHLDILSERRGSLVESSLVVNAPTSSSVYMGLLMVTRGRARKFWMDSGTVPTYIAYYKSGVQSSRADYYVTVFISNIKDVDDQMIMECMLIFPKILLW